MAKRKEVTGPTIDPSSLELKDVNVLGFTINNDPYNTYYPSQAERYDFGILTDLFSRKDYHLRVVITVTCKVIFDDGEYIETSFISECIFEVAPIAGVSRRKHFALEQLHKVTRLTAISIAYSTTRGLLVARAAGTILEGAILPIVNPGDLEGGEAEQQAKIEEHKPEVAG
jgi:hypothetical protein